MRPSYSEFLECFEIRQRSLRSGMARKSMTLRQEPEPARTPWRRRSVLQQVRDWVKSPRQTFTLAQLAATIDHLGLRASAARPLGGSSAGAQPASKYRPPTPSTGRTLFPRAMTPLVRRVFADANRRPRADSRWNCAACDSRFAVPVSLEHRGRWADAVAPVVSRSALSSPARRASPSVPKPVTVSGLLTSLQASRRS